MSPIEDDIEAFKEMRAKLEAEHMGRWVLIYQRNLVKVYDSFDEALQDAGQQFGKGPYLIRRVGAPPMVLPASVMYARFAASSSTIGQAPSADSRRKTRSYAPPHCLLRDPCGFDSGSGRKCARMHQDFAIHDESSKSRDFFCKWRRRCACIGEILVPMPRAGYAAIDDAALA